MIEVDNITKSYGETRALRGVSFRINKGEIVGLLGPNGAGKSTAMNKKKIICHLLYQGLRLKSVEIKQ